MISNHQIVILSEVGEQGFLPGGTWWSELKEEGICCSHCEGVRPEMRPHWNSVILDAVPPGRSVGLFLLGGLILRKDLAHAIGIETLERRCRRLRVMDEHGAVLPNFDCWVEREIRGKLRGSSSSKVGLCKECGRLLYWPIGDKYLLRKYWDSGPGVDILDNKIVCNGHAFRRIQSESGISSLVADPIDLLDCPTDGFPIDYPAFVQEVGVRELVR